MTKGFLAGWRVCLAVAVIGIVAVCGGCAVRDAIVAGGCAVKDAVVAMVAPEQPVEEMTPEQIAVETEKAEQIVAIGEAVAQAGEVLPFPLDFMLAGAGTLGVYLGRRKLAKLTKSALSTAIAPAVKVAGKFVKNKIEASAPAEESPAQPAESAPAEPSAQEPTAKGEQQ